MNDYDRRDCASARGDHDHRRRRTHSPSQRTWVKVAHENARAHDCGHRASANVRDDGDRP